MQALFLDQSDNTIFVAEIVWMSYFTDTNELDCYSEDGNEVTIPMSYDNAETFIRNIYRYGKVDLTEYGAFINAHDDEGN